MNILFVCTGNTCRSSMAEALFKAMLVESNKNMENITIHSAGVYAMENQGASRGAIDAMKSRGIDLTDHKSRPLNNKMVDEADLILTMTTSHKNAILNVLPEASKKTYTLKEYVNTKGSKDVSDPYGSSLEVYNQTAEEIKNALQKVLEKLDIK